MIYLSDYHQIINMYVYMYSIINQIFSKSSEFHFIALRIRNSPFLGYLRGNFPFKLNSKLKHIPTSLFLLSILNLQFLLLLTSCYNSFYYTWYTHEFDYIILMDFLKWNVFNVTSPKTWHCEREYNSKIAYKITKIKSIIPWTIIKLIADKLIHR